jgi:hypothetical protein
MIPDSNKNNSARRTPAKIAPPAFDAALIGTAPVHRRGFLGLFGVSGFAGALAATLPAPAAKGMTALLLHGGRLMLDQVTHTTFAGFLGSVFQMEIAPGRTTAAKLIEVNPLSQCQPPGAAERRVPFSLLFRVPPGLALTQRIYALEHPTLGRLDIFLVPIRQDVDGLVVEAVFN